MKDTLLTIAECITILVVLLTVVAVILLAIVGGYTILTEGNACHYR